MRVIVEIIHMTHVNISRATVFLSVLFVFGLDEDVSGDSSFVDSQISEVELS